MADVLVLDDDTQVLGFLSNLFGRRGYVVRAFSRAEPALDDLRARAADAVLADIDLPGMNGMEFLQEAKRLRPECPVIFITGFPKLEFVRKALQLGAADFLAKPLNATEVEEAVARVIREKARSAVSLGLAKADREEPARPTTPAPEASRGQVAPKILVADDDESVLVFLRSALSASGYRVLLARSGEGALRLVRTERPDLAILDYRMAGPDGIEVCRRIKSTPEGALISVVIMTGAGTGKDKLRSWESGADDYFEKPLKVWELLTRVDALLKAKARAGRGGAPSP